MKVYVLAYDIVNEASDTFDYQPLWNELLRLNAQRTLLSFWLVRLENSPREVAEHFKSFVDEPDRIWVTQLRKGEYHYEEALPGTNAWIDTNPPT